MRAGQRAVLIVWTIAFLIGAFNHGTAILRGGWLPYRFAPFACNLFWTALFPVDLVTAALLWTRPRAGIWLAVIVMLADVAVNSWTVRHFALPGLPTALQLQTLFLGFVLGSAAWLPGTDALFLRRRR